MLTVNNLTVKNILTQISLSFELGKIHGILGPNGSGKTTLLRCLAGIKKPQSGLIYWCERDLLSLERKQAAQLVSLVPQAPPYLFNFTVEEMVAMGRFPHGTPRSQLSKYVHQALTRVDALSFLQRPISSLSAGERQRVYIARALATDSPVLLLDEPTSFLDFFHEQELSLLLRFLASQGKLIILSLHNLQLATRLLDTATFLEKGQMTLTGPASTVLPKIYEKINTLQNCICNSSEEIVP